MLELPLSDHLSLRHSSFSGQGKTKKMAKGLILCHKDQIFAGESSGFGLPVLKKDHETIFPSFVSSGIQKPGVIESVYHLNLINTWQVAGVAAPAFFSTVMEKLVDGYMRRPGWQLSGLKIRNALFQLFQIRSTMVPGSSFGYCRVQYQAEDCQLKVKVDFTANHRQELLPQTEQLILLNEVPGTGFSRMVDPGTSGPEIFDNNEFLPWQPCTMGTAVENPDLQIGFFLSVPGCPEPSCFQIAAEREVGRDLNWAGLSIATDERAFTYQVNFYHKTTDFRP